MKPRGDGSVQAQQKLWRANYLLLGLHIWSLFDAVHMAKVNNLEFRSQYPNSVNLNMAPYFGSEDYNKYINDVPLGLTLSINF